MCTGVLIATLPPAAQGSTSKQPHSEDGFEMQITLTPSDMKLIGSRQHWRTRSVSSSPSTECVSNARRAWIGYGSRFVQTTDRRIGIRSQVFLMPTDSLAASFVRELTRPSVRRCARVALVESATEAFGGSARISVEQIEPAYFHRYGEQLWKERRQLTARKADGSDQVFYLDTVVLRFGRSVVVLTDSAFLGPYALTDELNHEAYEHARAVLESTDEGYSSP